MDTNAALAIAAAPVVVAIVAAAETAGLPSRFAPIAALLVALAGALADVAARLYPAANPWIQAAAVAVTVAIAAVGGHTVVTGYLDNQGAGPAGPLPAPAALPTMEHLPQALADAGSTTAGEPPAA